MLVVRHEFKDKFTGESIKVGTILKIEDEERKKELIDRQLIEEAEVLVLKNEIEVEHKEDERTVKEIKQLLDDAGIKYGPKDNKSALLELLKDLD